MSESELIKWFWEQDLYKEYPRDTYIRLNTKRRTVTFVTERLIDGVVTLKMDEILKQANDYKNSLV